MDNNAEGTTIEVLMWLSRATMDIIGTAGESSVSMTLLELIVGIERLWIRIQFTA